MKFIATIILLSFFQIQGMTQIYFMPDTLHEWRIDTVLSQDGEIVEFIFNGSSKSVIVDSLIENVCIHTDTSQIITFLSYQFRDVWANLSFLNKSCSFSSANVGNTENKRSSLGFTSSFPIDKVGTESVESNRRKIKQYENGILSIEYEELLINYEWKTVYYSSYSPEGDLSIFEKLNDQGNGYHLEYDDKGNIYRSCVILNFERVNCPQ